MQKFTIQPFDACHIPAVMEIQSAYSAMYPDAPVVPGEVYLSPAFEGNIFCVVDESGKVVGYAPLYPVLMRDDSQMPHTLWVEVKTHPEPDAQNEIKDLLFERILSRAREVTSEVPGHPVRLTFQYFPSETASVEYVTSKECQHTESVFTMRRDLAKEITRVQMIDGITIRPWRMESEAEQQTYVDARSECFPEAPVALGEWQYFMQSLHWAAGTTMAAFDGDELVGNVALFWDEAENQKSGKQIGFTEYIFVRPLWRGKNIARKLINAGLAWLKEHGMTEAHLEVRAENESALHLYVDLGYEVIRESRFYVLKI
ncbi:MAG: GNAT family N-acetyltransferase [Anaerolineales bacterium]